MKKKGFTLVELLAVIVILAILALIAVPIVLKVIDNSEEQSEMQSILGYARVIEGDIANWKVINPEKDYSTYKLPSYDDLKEQYKGNEVACKNTDIDATKGEIKLSCCKVKGGSGKSYDYYQDKVKISSKNSCNGEDESSEDDNDNAVTQLFSKTNPATLTTYEQGSEASHQMYTFEHPATEQTESLIDCRYIGNDPYNYVQFNNETWRIIGIFTVEDENGNKEPRLKLIRDEFIGSFFWYSKSWFGGVSWEKSEVEEHLNENYYENDINDESKGLMSSTKYYLGERGHDAIPYGTASDIYVWERGTARYNEYRAINWVGKIGLMYPSDYAYTYANGVEENCYNDAYSCVYNNGNISDSWLYMKNSHEWLMIASGVESTSVINDIGGLSYQKQQYSSLSRPVVYLKSSVKIDSGTGTKYDPYKFKL